jgi:hypothetical protein
LALKYSKPKPKNHGQNHLDSIANQVKNNTFLVADLSKNMALPAYSIPFE